MEQTKVVAMLLAGGQGSRLKSLTKNSAKPAVEFGGKYRIIDFALSNAMNSGIRDIGILTQYRPFELNAHIGIGAPWDFDRNVGGLRILPPYMSEDGGRWYTGTANAIYENIDFLEELNPDHVLILSGDHIYKMNYDKMLTNHKSTGADVTIATMEVPWKDTFRFGILNTTDDNKIYEFDEKPVNAKSNQASMGIYMFKWDKLKKYLLQDHDDANTNHDFGMDILPLMLDSGCNMFAYEFMGYWKDVGTVDSYWEANMDLLDNNNKLQIYDKTWRIFTNNLNLPPQYIGPNAQVKYSLINEGCDILGTVEGSVLSSRVIVEEGAVLTNCVVLSNCLIKKGAKINNAVILQDTIIENDVSIGLENDGIYLVSNDEVTRE